MDIQKLKEVSSRFVLQANKDRVNTLVDANCRVSPNVKVRSSAYVNRIILPASWPASNFMSNAVTPYNGVTKETVQDLVDSLNQLLAAESSRMDATASSAILMLWLTTLLAIVIGCFAAIFISRRIIGSVNAILQRAQAVAGGDLSGKPLEPTTQDEIAELELAMNEMTGSLSDSGRRHFRRACKPWVFGHRIVGGIGANRLRSRRRCRKEPTAWPPQRRRPAPARPRWPPAWSSPPPALLRWPAPPSR